MKSKTRSVRIDLSRDLPHRARPLAAADVAQKVYEAVRDERFYILTHPKIKPAIQWRMEDILQERNPTDPMG